jgi:hypothetical protein
MTDDDDIQDYVRPCPNCEYHRQRAQLWRDEAYKQAGHPLPEREQKPMHPQLKVMLEEYFDKCFAQSAPHRTWVGLTDEEIMQCLDQGYGINMRLDGFARIIEAKLKEKNT